MSPPPGFPLLSGTLPDPVGSEHNCMKCNKEFLTIFVRSKRCNYCGYSYCSTCIGYNALMPQDAGGYVPVPVCAFCYDNLRITASSRNVLMDLSPGKLKSYADAYGLRYSTGVEKGELVDKLISYRRQNGSLPPENEDFYRKHSVPKPTTPRRGFFSRNAHPAPVPAPAVTLGSSSTRQSHFSRPDVESNWRSPPQPRPTSMPQTQPQSQYSTPPQPSSRPQQFNLNVPQPNRPRTTSHGAATQSLPPTLDQLLTMPPEDIKSLPVSVLKEILFHNRVDTRLVIEKSDLVERVMTLIANEREERERQEIHRQMEEEEEERLRHMEIGTETHSERLDEPHLDSEHQTSDSEQIPTVSAVDMTNPEQQTTTNTKATLTRPAMAKNLERSGLCVVCQDEEANIAVVDCGHMAMCRGCSDLIIKSSRECPLCRTRIVTEARLLRIYKP